jgi:quinol-cytochrome oxidoreductase complex cytochrome b subunit
MRPAFWFAYASAISCLIVLGVYATGKATRVQLVILLGLLFALFFFLSAVIEITFRQYRSNDDYRKRSKDTFR